MTTWCQHELNTHNPSVLEILTSDWVSQGIAGKNQTSCTQARPGLLNKTPSLPWKWCRKRIPSSHSPSKLNTAPQLIGISVLVLLQGTYSEQAWPCQAACVGSAQDSLSPSPCWVTPAPPLTKQQELQQCLLIKYFPNLS